MIKGFFDNLEEIFTGAVLQFPLYFIVGWWVIPIMGVCGLLWRLGGVTDGNKLFRKLLIPLIVCFSAFIYVKTYVILLAVPFMLLLAPAYGETSWLFKLTKSDFVTRLITYAWYWGAFLIAYQAASFLR